MGNQGFQGEARGPAGSVIRRKERNTAATSNLYATQVRDNENLHHRQTYGGIQVSHPA